MRRFIMQRDSDVSGVSGSGNVAEGCQFDNGWCALTWLTGVMTLSFYSSIEELEMIHGHGGATRIAWIDDPQEDDEDDE